MSIHTVRSVLLLLILIEAAFSSSKIPKAAAPYTASSDRSDAVWGIYGQQTPGSNYLTKRDSGYSSYSMGSYGGGGAMGTCVMCCPSMATSSLSSSTDNPLLSFGLGALLGFLFSMLPMMTMMVTTSTPQPIIIVSSSRRSTVRSGKNQDSDLEVTTPSTPTDPPMTNPWTYRSQPKNTTNLQQKLMDQVTALSPPLLKSFTDLMNVFEKSKSNDDCREKWMCKATKEWMRKNKKLTGISSEVTKATIKRLKTQFPIFEEMYKFADTDLRCNSLSPFCKEIPVISIGSSRQKRSQEEEKLFLELIKKLVAVI